MLPGVTFHFTRLLRSLCTVALVSLFLIATLQLQAQPKSRYDITGTWTGYVKTTDKQIRYEVVISDTAGGYTGYSKIVFNNKGKETSAVKSLLISRDEDKYILEEDSLLRDNFDKEAPRKIKQVNTLELVIGTKKMSFSGTFKTKATMGLRSATGEVYLQKSLDPDTAEIIQELKQLDLTEQLSFVKEAKARPVPVAVVDTPVVVPPPPPVVAVAPAPAPRPVQAPPPPAPKATLPPARPAPVATAPARPRAVTPPPAAPPPAPAPPPVAKATLPPSPKPANRFSAPPPDLTRRSIENIETVYFKTDSLTLTLYDNGEVDGDTVSVLVNGKVIMSKKGLSTRPITETLYLTPDLGDSLQMIMYAENLGSIAPNTGLLIIQDGRDRYEIRFSGDLKKNAAIVFKRKKSQVETR